MNTPMGGLEGLRIPGFRRFNLAELADALSGPPPNGERGAREVLCDLVDDMGVESDIPALDYVVVQITREVLTQARETVQRLRAPSGGGVQT